MVNPPTQALYKLHMAHCTADPEAMQAALVPVNRWNRQERTLAHAIAEALREAYDRGREGLPLSDAEAPQPEHKPTHLLRRRKA